MPLQADGTTLGADNGIGVATALALLDLPNSAEYPLPPLECLFTVDEETGLTGAFDLDPSLLTGMPPLFFALCRFAGILALAVLAWAAEACQAASPHADDPPKAHDARLVPSQHMMSS